MAAHQALKVSNPQIPLQIPAEQQSQVENHPKTTKPKFNQYMKKPRKILTVQDTAFLRRRKVAEVQGQKLQGVYLQSSEDSDLMKFDDFPVMSLDDLQALEEISEMQSHNTMRLQDPANDENLSTEFWAMEGMTQGQFHSQLPRSSRHTVPSMEMIYPR
jgi:hypothetical protein